MTSKDEFSMTTYCGSSSFGALIDDDYCILESDSEQRAPSPRSVILKQQQHQQPLKEPTKNSATVGTAVDKDESSFLISSIGAFSEIVRDKLCFRNNSISSTCDDYDEVQPQTQLKAPIKDSQSQITHRISQKNGVVAQYKRLQELKGSSSPAIESLRRIKSFDDCNFSFSGTHDQYTRVNKDNVHISKENSHHNNIVRPKKSCHENNLHLDDDSDLEWLLSCTTQYCAESFEVIWNDDEPEYGGADHGKNTDSHSYRTDMNKDDKSTELCYDSDIEHIRQRRNRPRDAIVCSMNQDSCPSIESRNPCNFDTDEHYGLLSNDVLLQVWEIDKYD